MFYYKKNKDKPNIDMDREHSTLEVHVMSTDGVNITKCHGCNKELKNGDCCGVVSIGGKMVVEHERCEK